VFESISDRENVKDREEEPVSISEIEPGLTLRVVSGDIPS
jgi:hypothetical protein